MTKKRYTRENEEFNPQMKQKQNKEHTLVVVNEPSSIKDL